MSAMGIMTTMISEAKESVHARHIEEFYLLCQALINESVPQLIKNELANMDSELLVRIQTQINGRNIDFPDVRQYIREIIEDELRKIVNEIRL